MLYRLVNQEAKNWWYHDELRKQGNPGEARRRERISVRHTIATLRRAMADNGYFTVGRGGCVLHYANGSLSGWSRDYVMELARICKLPVIDTLDAPIAVAFAFIHAPMVALGRPPDTPENDNGEYGPMQYAPLGYLLDFMDKAGAKVYRPEAA